MSDNLKKKTVSGLIWSFAERFSLQGVQFVIGIIMARLLTPSDFGVVGMLGIFIAVSQSIIDSGFSNALIRKQDRSEVDYSTVFYFNIVVGLVLYFILYFSAPLIADFYKTPVLTELTKVIGLTLLINSLAVVQRARLTVIIDFKTQAKASFVSVLIGGGIGVYMAYSGMGVWSLIMQTIISSSINTLLLWYFANWIPLLHFSIDSFKELFSFGSKLLLSGIIDTIYRNIYTIVIGKKFSAQSLGYYTRADQFAQFPSSNITGILGRVTYPILSSIQHDDDRLRQVYRKYLRLSAFVVFPSMTGLAAVAKPTIQLLLSEEWLPVAPLLQALCFSMMWYPIHAINLNLLQVKGRSDLFLRLEVIKKVIGIVILFLTIPLGILAMCIGLIFSSIICLVINTHYTGKLIQVGFFCQMKDLLPILFTSIIMGCGVWLSTSFISNRLISLVLGIIIGIFIYSLLNYLTKSKEFSEIRNFR